MTDAFERPIRNLFLFIGAGPATEWLRDCGVVLDDKSFVLTGVQATDDGRPVRSSARAPTSLETNQLGVFAVGDVRSGSVKRVGAAIGEGAALVPQLHTFITDTMRPAVPDTASADTRKRAVAMGPS